MSKVRAKTQEEIRQELIAELKSAVSFWLNQDTSEEDKLNGVVFSMLSLIDGVTSMPSFDLVVHPHKDDKAFCIANSLNWYEPNTVINEDVMLHSLWYKNN